MDRLNMANNIEMLDSLNLEDGLPRILTIAGPKDPKTIIAIPNETAKRLITFLKKELKGVKS